MVFYIKNLETEFRIRYKERLRTVKGSLVVLRKLIIDERKRKKPVLKEAEEDKRCIYLSNNFNCLYEGVLEVIVEEERINGSSVYRSMLDRIDERLDDLTSASRKEVTEIEKIKAREIIASKPPAYARPVYHLPLNMSEVRVL